MGSNHVSPGKKFFNSIEKRKRIEQFKSRIQDSLIIIMEVKNTEERLRMLLKLREDELKEISDIASIIDFRQTSIVSIITGNPEWENYLGNPVSEPEDPQKAKETVQLIHSLENYIIPINREITRLQLNRNAKKKAVKKTIDEQYTALFRDSSISHKVIMKFKSQLYIDGNERWQGKTNIKGELNVACDVLRSLDLLKEGKETTQNRIFYERFKYDGTMSERSLRNIPKDIDIRDGFESLFKPLLGR